MKFEAKPNIVELILTAQSPIIHGDPSVQRDTNITTFNRQKQILSLDPLFYGSGDDERLLKAISEHHPVTSGLKKLFMQASTAEVIAVILVRLFIEIYSGKGLFVDADRYTTLEGRVKAASMKAGSLSTFWGGLLDAMTVNIQPGAYDGVLGEIFSLSQKLQALALSVLVENGAVVIFKARLWNNALKDARKNEGPAANSKIDTQRLISDPDVTDGKAETLDLLAMLANPTDSQREETQSSVIEVPTVSPNTIRNRLIRTPGWEHLCAALGFNAMHPGDGDLPLGVEALFVNGGNIESGGKQPNAPEAMANAIRRKYPLVDLLGGVINSVILGRSCLSVNSWLVCRENAAILERTSAAGRSNLRISAFQMVDSEMKIRTKTSRGVGQSMANAESLAIGSEIFVRLTLAPFTQDLTKGALFAALRTFEAMPHVGAHSSTGGGLMDMDLTREIDGADALLALYEEYLVEHKDELRQGLVTGTLAIGDKALCA